MSRLIQHQIQPCPVSCVSTCVAMLKGIRAQIVVDQIHKRYRESNMTLREMLNEIGVEFSSFDTCDRAPLADAGAYLVVVPSLNIVAGTHQILIEVTDDNYFVIDPVQGRDGKKYYVKSGEVGDDPFAVALAGFTVEAFVSAEQLRQRQQ